MEKSEKKFPCYFLISDCISIFSWKMWSYPKISWFYTSSLIYIHVNSFYNITSSMVSGYEYLTLTWEIQVQFPFKPRPFLFFLLFPKLNFEIWLLKKASELKRFTWKIVQLNLKLNSILLISQLLNYRFSKVRPFLESME